MYLKAYIKQLRPKNWLKNIFVFIPLVFSLTMMDSAKLTATIIVFVTFCLISSAIYIFNDIRDVKIDRQHPVKCKRPIASRAISEISAMALAVVLTFMSFGISFYVNSLAALIIGLYVAENVAYTLWLKHMPIVDCFCIAVGFILRVYAGSIASDEPVSDWLFLAIVAMSLFMAFGKRRGEMLKIDKANQRTVLESYDLTFLNGMMFCTAGLSVVFYSLWAMDRGMYMIYTVPVIIFIVCKYLLLVHDEKSYGDPIGVITSSHALLAACVVYAVLTVALLYTGRFA